MYKHIIDEMKKEGKLFRNLMIFGYILAVLIPVGVYLTNDGKYTESDVILFIVTFFLFGTIGLYGWLYAIKYKLEVNEEKLILKTLFKKVEINICDITNYACKRYGKSLFYQFELFLKNKRVLVNTRYKEEFEKLLRDNKIEQKIK